MANNTTYGRGGGLWTKNLKRAHMMGGTWNRHGVDQCHQRSTGLPAGVKEAGYGPNGHFAMLSTPAKIGVGQIDASACVLPG